MAHSKMERHRDHKDIQKKIDWKCVLLEVKQQIERNEISRSAFARLVTAGCDEDQILTDLYLYCGGSSDEIQSLRREIAYRKRHVATTARMLRSTANLLEPMPEWLAEVGWEYHQPPTSRSLRDYAELLEILWRNLPPRKRESGRDQHLVALHHHVRSRTSKSHYAELADLVNTVRGLYRPDDEVSCDPEAIRKQIQRHMPVAFSELLYLALKD
jgi:hypothetical protein